MPIPNAKSPPASPSASSPAGGAHASRPVRVLAELPNLSPPQDYPELPETPIFLYFADPTHVQIVDGEALYLPVKVPLQPGLQGCRDGSIASAVEYETRTNRRTVVPHDRPVRAWGVEHGGYIQAVDLRPDARGKPRVHHADVWTRYEVVGAQVQTSYDRAGFLDFCRSLVDLLGPVHPGVAEGTRSRLRSLAAEHRRGGAASPGLMAVADAIEAQLQPRLP